MSGNRPASKARVATPGEAFQDGWTGGEGAGDFLELEGSLGMSYAPAGEGQRTSLALAEELPDASQRPEASTATDPWGEVPMSPGQREAMIQARMEAGGGEPEEEGIDVEVALEGEEPLDEEAELVPVAAKPRVGRLVLVAFGLGLAAMGVVKYFEPEAPAPLDPVARVAPNDTDRTQPSAGSTSGTPSRTSGSGAAGSTGPARPGGLAVDPEVARMQLPAMLASATLLGLPMAPTPEVGELASLDLALPRPPSAGDPALDTTGAPFTELSGDPALDATGAPFTNLSGDPFGRPGELDPLAAWDPSTGVPPGAEAMPIAGGIPGPDASGSFASAATWLSDTTVIYQGDVVPLDRVHGPIQIKTPAVGVVRVLLHEGDTFEGRLYAVGQSKLWVDTNLGRMGLAADTIALVERLVGELGEGAVPVEASMVGERVRARTPGGQYLYGHLGKVEDGSIVLVTDAGARIRLKTAEVERIAGAAKIRLTE